MINPWFGDLNDMDYLLDTNHCSQIILQNLALLDQLLQHQNDRLFTCAIVQGELIDMAERSRNKTDNLALVKRFLNNIEVHPVTPEIADTYGYLRASIFEHFAPKDPSQRRQFQLRNLGFGDNDLWIAATAIRYGLTLVSRDSDFNRLQEVIKFPLESWTA